MTILHSYPPSNPGTSLARRVIGDIDGDGIRDVVFARPTGFVEMYSGRTGQFLQSWTMVGPTIDPWPFFELGDADGDGLDDFLYLVRDAVMIGTQTYAQVRSSATGAVLYTSPGVPYNTWYNQRVAGIGDITGDGKVEIVFGDPAAGGNAGAVHVINPVTGAILRSHFGSFPGEYRSNAVAIGDHDGDGHEDYIVRSLWGGVTGYSGLTGQQLFVPPGVGSSFGQVIEKVGDFNADGFDDVALWTNGDYPFSSFEQTSVFGGPAGTLLWQRAYIYGQPIPPDFGFPSGPVGDLDADGFDDLDLVSMISSRVVSGRSHAVVLESPWGFLGSPGDANGDGVRDLFVVFPTGGVWALHVASGAPPGVATIGTPCQDPTGNSPAIGITIGARLGQTMNVNLSNANPNLLLAVLALGNSDQQWSGVPLPFDLGLLGMPGCLWRISGDVVLTLPTAGASGLRHHATWPIAVPQNSQLLGVNVFAQWLVLELGPAGLTGAATRAVRATVVQ